MIDCNDTTRTFPRTSEDAFGVAPGTRAPMPAVEIFEPRRRMSWAVPFYVACVFGAVLVSAWMPEDGWMLLLAGCVAGAWQIARRG